jgi:hypothetical protein
VGLAIIDGEKGMMLLQNPPFFYSQDMAIAVYFSMG